MSSVQSYTKDICDCASRLVKGRTVSSEKTGLISAVVAGVTNFITLPFYFNPVYHLSGFLAYSVEIGVSRYAAHKASKFFENKKFFEYGLDEYFEESTLFLPKHPTTKDLRRKKVILAEASLLAASTIFAPLGYCFLATTYLDYKTNSTITREIEKAILIGDQVNEKIRSRTPEREIREWLRHVPQVS